MFAFALTLIVIAGLLLRLAIIASPFGWIDADEAIVGLMARHIVQGERPGYYWGVSQEYLGALEAYSVAAVFAVFGSSTAALKIVPGLYSLGFIVLSALVARRLFGPGPGLFTAAYLALPPMMLALWSVKARGGYAELLFLGESMLLLTLMVLTARRPAMRAGALGLIGGLAFWTNPLAVVYLVPAVVYLIAAPSSTAIR
jgi:hypothetical protein